MVLTLRKKNISLFMFSHDAMVFSLHQDIELQSPSHGQNGYGGFGGEPMVQGGEGVTKPKSQLVQRVVSCSSTMKVSTELPFEK